ncbi:hypothetical protein FE249_18055 (plasmid) [Acidiphilium multivorum]|uniref:hypothetical protein n=1 Tax=Acidiphilium TaxID=522 RepID=UPI00157B9F76|nr:MULTISPECIES: hypothetical protein [Acidiphilium]UNC16161.1 hypothetical protein FE249_18055 [Acidiphilium multivorum]
MVRQIPVVTNGFQPPGKAPGSADEPRDIRLISDPVVRGHLVGTSNVLVRTGSTKRGRKGVASFRVWFDGALGWHVRIGRGGARRARLSSCEISSSGFIFRMHPTGA